MSTSSMTPFLVRPRLDAKPWGGSRLSTFGYAAAGPEPLGEVVMTATASLVDTGPHAGRSLGELVAADPVGIIGARGLAATGGRSLFPLLVKLIDADQPLSIQVHPDDGRAGAVDALGKTEAWHILAAEPGAVLYVGLVEGATLEDMDGDVVTEPVGVAGRLRRLPAVPGETVFLPAGTLHALGAGVTIYEVQQASEITYRLDDWGRVDAAGLSREMHVAESLEATDPSLRPAPVVPVPLSAAGAERELLVACRYFALDRFRVAAGGSTEFAASDSPQTVTVVRGSVALQASGSSTTAESTRVETGRTVVVPAACPVVRVHTAEGAELLRAWVPDLAAEVVAPALAVGASRAEVAALSFPLGDVAEAIGGGPV